MPTIAIEHITRYRYDQPVSLGEHRLLMRPRESYDQRLLEADLHIQPAPESLRWIQDAFGNAKAIAEFAGKTTELEVRATATVEHRPLRREDIRVEEYAREWPFTYAAEDLPDLARSVERKHADPRRLVDEWAAKFLSGSGPTRTLDLLAAMTEAIQQGFAYQAREEEGTQTPLETLERGGGHLPRLRRADDGGPPARWASPRGSFPATSTRRAEGRSRVGGHSTHAWVRVFLPGSGWVEFDPTNGITGNDGLIRTAIARDPVHAKPMTGSITGPSGNGAQMEVDVRIERVAAAG